MKTKVILAIVFIVLFTALSSVVMAGNPKEKDRGFLLSDPDNDTLLTWEEFVLGTDPFSSDSDNDGLPDDWEHEYSPYLDPADPSDAHLDADYDYILNNPGVELGERNSNFSAIGKKMDVWPADKDITFKTPLLHEEGIHYDNYEEYYRPYTDLKNPNLIRYMHTSPIDPDTDDDNLLDPDDFEPIGYPNDGFSPGGIDKPKDESDLEKKESEFKEEEMTNEQTLKPIYKIPIKTDFDIHILPDNEDKYTEMKSAYDMKDEYFLSDLDTDGF